jgi:ABC-type multidrug transport system fused ATPase/permease subunit
MNKFSLHFRSRIGANRIIHAFKLLNSADLMKLFFVSILQILLSFLDLLGIAVMGLLGALSVSGIRSTEPSEGVSRALSILNMSTLSIQEQSLILGAAATFILMSKTIASIIVTRRVLFFMSRRAAEVSSDLTRDLLSQDILFVRKFTTQETVYMITVGVQSLIINVLGMATVLVADISLLVILFFGLGIFDIATAIGTILVFGSTSILLYRSMHIKSKIVGTESTKLQIAGSEKLVEIFTSLREVIVRNRQVHYVAEFRENRVNLADKTAEMNFMPYTSKYVIESTVLVGALTIASLQFVLFDAMHAVSTLTIFLAAGSRLAPALLRVQQGLIQVRQGLIAGEPTMRLLETLRPHFRINQDDETKIDFLHDEFEARIECEGVFFGYPQSNTDALSNVNLNIDVGSFVAIVGTSASGKSTLVDVLLGILDPKQGNVSISGMKPSETLSRWPGAIAYVPQDVFIHSGSIRSNVAMGFNEEDFSDEDILQPLQTAQLGDLIEGNPGLDLAVGERGITLSGGQRQRLGIARALFTKPKLLILDEATSSLDAETELAITNSILSLKGTMTIVVVAHRLSTIKNADKIYYLENGEIIAQGNFEEVRRLSKNFDNQAKLMGL